MTPGELKFALEVETVLNSIPQPEYRQLMVEALMVLTILVEYDAVKSLGAIINVEHLVHKANHIFLEDQVNNFMFSLRVKTKIYIHIFVTSFLNSIIILPLHSH